MQPCTSAGHLGLGVGRQHDEGVLDAPVGGVGDVRDARQAVELDVVLARCARPSTRRARWRRSPTGANCAAKRSHRRARGAPAARRRSASRSASAAGRAALLDLVQAVVQRLDQQLRGASGCRAGRPAGRGCAAPPRCRPAPRTACAPSGRCGARSRSWSSSSQARAPSRRMHDLAVGERGVVVGNLAQPRRVVGQRRGAAAPARSGSWAAGAFMQRQAAAPGRDAWQAWSMRCIAAQQFARRRRRRRRRVIPVAAHARFRDRNAAVIKRAAHCRVLHAVSTSRRLS